MRRLLPLAIILGCCAVVFWVRSAVASPAGYAQGQFAARQIYDHTFNDAGIDTGVIDVGDGHRVLLVYVYMTNVRLSTGIDFYTIFDDGTNEIAFASGSTACNAVGEVCIYSFGDPYGSWAPWWGTGAFGSPSGAVSSQLALAVPARLRITAGRTAFAIVRVTIMAIGS